MIEMVSYIVTAGAVVLKTVDAGERMLFKGRTFSESDYDRGSIKHVVDQGLAKKVDEAPAEDDGPKSLDDMKLDELKAHAKEHGIELSGATKKDDVLAAIKSAEAKPAQGDGEGGPVQGSEPEQPGTADNE